MDAGVAGPGPGKYAFLQMRRSHGPGSAHSYKCVVPHPWVPAGDPPSSSKWATVMSMGPSRGRETPIGMPFAQSRCDRGPDRAHRRQPAGSHRPERPEALRAMGRRGVSGVSLSGSWRAREGNWGRRRGQSGRRRAAPHFHAPRVAGPTGHGPLRAIALFKIDHQATSLREEPHPSQSH